MTASISAIIDANVKAYIFKLSGQLYACLEPLLEDDQPAKTELAAKLWDKLSGREFADLSPDALESKFVPILEAAALIITKNDIAGSAINHHAKPVQFALHVINTIFNPALLKDLQALADGRHSEISEEEYVTYQIVRAAKAGWTETPSTLTGADEKVAPAIPTAARQPE